MLSSAGHLSFLGKYHIPYSVHFDFLGSENDICGTNQGPKCHI